VNVHKSVSVVLAIVPVWVLLVWSTPQARGTPEILGSTTTCATASGCSSSPIAAAVTNASRARLA
jgi:hypothetical protein